VNGFDDDLYDEEDELEEREFHYRRRDTKVDEAKTVLANELFIDAGAVYYGQQIEVLYEQRFFHWITARASNRTSKRRADSSGFRSLDRISPHQFLFLTE